MESLPYGNLVGGEYRNNLFLCGVMPRGRLAELNTATPVCHGKGGNMKK